MSAGTTAVIGTLRRSAALLGARRLSLGVAALALLLAVGAVWMHAAQPTDLLVVRQQLTAWPANGIPVAVRSPVPGGVRSGDIVVAIDGRSTESWADDLFNPGATHPNWQIGERHIYTVERNGHRLNLPVTIVQYPMDEDLVASWSTNIFGLAFALIAMYIFVRRPGERLSAPLLVAGACLLPATVGYQHGLTVSEIVSGSGYWMSVATMVIAYSVFLASVLHATLLFPRPHPWVVTRRWLIPTLYLVIIPLSLGYLAITRWLSGSTIQWLGTWQPGQRTLALIYEGLVAVVLVASYRANRDAVTRQQIRWVAFGGAIAAGSTVVFWLAPVVLTGHALLSGPPLGLLQTVFPVTLAIAILRYRLFDIDIIINRALVYGSLTAILAAIYFGAVIALGTLVRDVTGQVAQQPVVIVTSTLLIAALFQPLRVRLQSAIDRRFYRHKYDAALTLRAFNASLRHELDLEDLREQLVAVVEETMQPTSVSLWVRKPGGGH